MATPTIARKPKLERKFIRANVEGVAQYGQRWLDKTNCVAQVFVEWRLSPLVYRNEILKTVRTLLQEEDSAKNQPIG